MEIKKSAFVSVTTAKEMTEAQKRAEETRASSAGIAETPDSIERFFKTAGAFTRDLAPQWTDYNDADPGITMLETLAYSADILTAYQERIVSEAFLNTAGGNSQLIDLTADLRSAVRTDIIDRLTASKEQNASEDED